ncbi:MAG: site-specific DNA-methyltransferase [Candidatus Poribacteria bacterium]|nr:site-specific DNA-methyltransferase [Candidatus Poribacteria bacterium]
MKKQMQSFGVTDRVGYNSDNFYKRNIYAQPTSSEANVVENPIPKENLSKIFLHSSEDMSELPDNSVHLMITSPPYNVGKEYDEDLTLNEYLSMLKRVWKETYRVLTPGGRVCINVANIGRKPYLPLNAFIVSDMIELGYLMRGEIIWNKGASAGTSCAWGSWLSASNPVLRDVHEYILVFSKSDFKRKKRESTVQKEDFMESTKSIWDMPAASAKRVGHPAPFPVELPRRLIELYSFKGDIVLDPFMGSGTTAIAAEKTNRQWVGYDISQEYIEIAYYRLYQERSFIEGEPNESVHSKSPK